MSTMLLSVLLSLQSVAADDGIHDAKSLITAIEAIQHSVEDFRCEFEGTLYYRGKVAEDPSTKPQIGPDGLAQAFDGVFTWKRGGETRSDGMYRMQGIMAGIQHKILVVRPSRNESEWYIRFNDAPLGKAVIQPPQKGSSHSPDCYGYIFLIDHIKQEVADETNLVATVTDDQIEGRALKVLSFTMKGFPDAFLECYWIDLRRGGHVVRNEIYRKYEGSGKLVMDGRLDIKLDSFKVGDAEVWMPVSGEDVGYGASELTPDKKRRPIVSDKPTVLISIKVVDGSMEFNKHPGPEVFTIKYKPGTPISDNLRQMTYEFGQQKLAAKPTKSEIEAMLKEQVANAEKQKSELVAAPLSEGIDWSSWLLWGMVAAVLASSIMLWIQRRR
jgi:hypothetical protein